jgi:hypothetical protein
MISTTLGVYSQGVLSPTVSTTMHNSNSNHSTTTVLPLESTHFANQFALNEDKSEVPEWLKLSFALLYIVLFFVGLIGNLIVIYFVLFYKRMQTMTNKFITNLSLADLLVICVCIPVTVSNYFSDQWLFGEFMCRITPFIQGILLLQNFSDLSIFVNIFCFNEHKGVALSVSVLTLTAISIDRYFIIYKPIKARSICTNRRIRFVLIMIWLLSCIIMSPLVFVFKYEELTIDISYSGLSDTIVIRKCYEKWVNQQAKIIYELFLIFVLFLGPAAFMAYAYRKIAQTLWFAEKNSSVLLHANSEANNRSRPSIYADSMSCDMRSSIRSTKRRATSSARNSRKAERTSGVDIVIQVEDENEKKTTVATTAETLPIDERTVNRNIDHLEKNLSKDLNRELDYSLLDVSTCDEEEDEEIDDNTEAMAINCGSDANSLRVKKKRRMRRKRNTPSISSNTNKAAVNSLMHQLQIYNTVKNKSFVNRNEQNIQKLIESRKRVVKLVIILIIMFLFSWLPYHVVSLVIDLFLYWEQLVHKGLYVSSSNSQTTSAYVYPVTLCLALTNSTTNPVCYMLLSHGFRSMFKASFTKMKRFFCSKKSKCDTSST